MITKTAVDEFLKQDKIAVYGVSRKKTKFGNLVYKELKAKGYQVYPVHSELQNIGGDPCYPSLNALPEKVGGVFICVSPEQTEEIVQEAARMGVKNIWLQQGAESLKAISYCQEHQLNLVYGECILMFAQPIGFPHSVHRFLWKMIGKLPK